MTTKSARSPSRSVPASRPNHSATSAVSRCTACSTVMNGVPARSASRTRLSSFTGSCRTPCCAGAHRHRRSPCGSTGPWRAALSCLGRWLATIVVQRTLRSPFSTSTSRKASSGCSPRSSAICPKLLPISVSSGHSTMVASWKSRCHSVGPSFLRSNWRAEPAAVLLVGQQFVALDLVAQMQGGGARAELLEDRAGRCRRSTARTAPAGAGTARLESQHPVENPCAGPNTCTATGFGLGVGRDQQAHPNPLAATEHPAAGQEEHQRRRPGSWCWARSAGCGRACAAP